MNYLAHLFLAPDTPASLLGNLAGDFVKGPVRGDSEIERGIRMHRSIDAFTDTHPAVAAFRRVLIPEHGHYARIISDVFFDHFLACDFDRYSSETLEGYVDRVFALIDPVEAARLIRVYPRLRGWILSYRDIDGIRRALGGLSHRLSRRPDLASATRHLTDSRDELARRFHEFFPQVVAFARNEERSGNVRA
jgi:acyl carrier protein phosphodiesterase